MSRMNLFRVLTVTTILTASGSAALAAPQFATSGPWVVKSGSDASSCLVSNRFDNGFGVRFSGSSLGVTSVAVDFRQPIFTAGQSYPARLQAGAGLSVQTQGQAASPTVLTFAVPDPSGFATSLMSAQSLSLDVSGNSMAFRLGDIGPALQNNAECGGAVPVAVSAPAPVPVNAAPLDSTASEQPVPARISKEQEVYIKRRNKPAPAFASPESIEERKKEENAAIAEGQAAQQGAPSITWNDVPEADEPIDLMKEDAVQAVQQTGQAQPLAAAQPLSILPPENSEVVQSDAEPVAAPAPVPVSLAAPVLTPAPGIEQNAATGESAMMASLRKAEEEIRKTYVQQPAVQAAPTLPAVAVSAPPLEPPYEPIVPLEPYEPISNIVVSDDAPKSAQDALSSGKRPQVAAIDIPAAARIPAVKEGGDPVSASPRPAPLPAPGIKTITPVPSVAAVQPVPTAVRDVASVKPKVAILPDALDILDAREDAVIPIRSTRSKDIFVARPEPVKPAPLEQAQASPVPTETIPLPLAQADLPKTQPKPQQWTAKAGEDVKIVLARWSERAGIDLVWESDRGGTLKNDVTVSGDIEQAVAAVMQQNGDTLGLQGAITSEHAEKNSAATPSAAKPAKPIEPKWTAEQGQSLRTVMEKWSRAEGVELLWNADRDFPAPESVQRDGAYEEAVQSALELFASGAARPVGQLNTDPSTGARTLIIETERVL